MIRALPQEKAGPLAAVFDRFEFHECNGAVSVFPQAILAELATMLNGAALTEGDLLKAGGGKSSVAATLELGLRRQGWIERTFQINVGSYEFETHRIDCCKSQFVTEIEWNNKDTFFDRDLGAFRLLHEAKRIEAAVILTRSSSLQQRLRSMVAAGDISADKFVSTTTHMDRLLPRLAGGLVGSCPLLAIGILPQAFRTDTVRADADLFVFA